LRMIGDVLALPHKILYFPDYASSYNSSKWPTWRTISSIVCLFESSTCFKQLSAHPQEDSCINTSSVIITRRPPTQSDYTRRCINTVFLLRMSTELLETCRGLEHIIEEIVCQVGHLLELLSLICLDGMVLVCHQYLTLVTLC
jgi:hypothetical protein